MARVTLTIDTDNAAFHDDDDAVTDGSGAPAVAEVARILRRLGIDWQHASENGTDLRYFDGLRLFDVNGNTVGTVTITR